MGLQPLKCCGTTYKAQLRKILPASLLYQPPRDPTLVDEDINMVHVKPSVQVNSCGVEMGGIRPIRRLPTATRRTVKRAPRIVGLDCEEEEPTYHWRTPDGERNAVLRQTGQDLVGVAVADTVSFSAVVEQNGNGRGSPMAVDEEAPDVQRDVELSSSENSKTTISFSPVIVVDDPPTPSVSVESGDDTDSRSGTAVDVEMLSSENSSRPGEPSIRSPPPRPVSKTNRRSLGLKMSRYPCLYRGCDRTFGIPKDRIRHMDTAHGKGSYQCLQCHSLFSRFDAVQRHRRDTAPCFAILTVKDKTSHKLNGSSWLDDISKLVEPAVDDPIRRVFQEKGLLQGEDLERFGTRRIRN